MLFHSPLSESVSLPSAVSRLPEHWLKCGSVCSGAELFCFVLLFCHMGYVVGGACEKDRAELFIASAVSYNRSPGSSSSTASVCLRIQQGPRSPTYAGFFRSVFTLTGSARLFTQTEINWTVVGYTRIKAYSRFCTKLCETGKKSN